MRKAVYRPAQGRNADRLPVARGAVRDPAARMNKTEQRYAVHLEQLRIAGQIVAWWYEPMSWRLADATYYRCDFLVLLPDGVLEVRECKAGTRDGRDFHATPEAWVKLKVVAESMPFPVVITWERAAGQWAEQRL